MLKDRCPTLRKMIETGRAESGTGESMPMHSQLSYELADAIYRNVLRERPEVVLEVGLAFGISTLAILTALDELGSGRLISIDPTQTSDWHSAGNRAVELAGFSERHTHVEKSDYVALPDLLNSKLKINFAYIDGWHTFDYVLMDFWYIDRMLLPNGVVAFNDCGYPAVDKAIQFVRSHRKYAEIDSGLPVNRLWQSRKAKLANWLTGQRIAPAIQTQDRYFRKLEHWEPTWNFFAEF